MVFLRLGWREGEGERRRERGREREREREREFESLYKQWIRQI